MNSGKLMQTQASMAKAVASRNYGGSVMAAPMEAEDKELSLRDMIADKQNRLAHTLEEVNEALKIVDSVEGFEEMFNKINKVINRY